MKRWLTLAVVLAAAVPSFAAIAATSLTTGQASTNSTFTTASVTPGTSHLMLLAVRNKKASGNGADAVTTITGNSLTWVLVDTVTFGAVFGTGHNQRISVYRALGASPSVGTISIAFGGITQDTCNWQLSDITGTTTAGTDGSGAIVQTATTFTVAATASPGSATLSTFSNVSNGTYAAWGIGNPGVTVTAGAGMTVIAQQTTNSSMGSEYAAGNVNPVQFSYSGTQARGEVALELAAAAPGPVASISPPSAAFGSTQVGNTSSPIVITLTNTGAVLMNISSIALTTGTQFAISANTCGATLASSASCTVSLTFSPLTTGAKTDTLVFTNDAGGSPQSVPVTGTGTTGPTAGGIGLGGNIAFGANIAIGPGVATPVPPSQCGPNGAVSFECSTHSTLAAVVPTRPVMTVNSHAYVYSAPSDFFYPLGGLGNCITRLTDGSSNANHSFVGSWGGGGNDLMWGTDRTYGSIGDTQGGRIWYISVSYDAQGCMHNNSTSLTTFSPGGTAGGFTFSRVNPNVAYHVLGNAGTGTVLNQETLTGTSPIVISNTTAVFDFKNCPGAPNHNSVGGNGALSVSDDDDVFTTNLNMSDVSGQGNAHWIFAYKRSTNSCATYYTGQVLTTENPANGNIWAYCSGNCSQTGTNPAPLGLNTVCAQPGFGVHGSQGLHNGLYQLSSGMCNGIVNSHEFWEIGTNNIQTCNDALYQCGGHGSAGYSTINQVQSHFNYRSVTNISSWTEFLLNIAEDFHGSMQWTGVGADTNPWMIATTMDTVAATCNTSPYCYELDAVRRDGVVARFMPSYFTFTTGSLGPISVMTQDGYCMIFSSNWNLTLGNDSSGVPRSDMYSVCNLQ